MRCVIIGMGPAGLACAETLLKERKDVTVTVIATDTAPYSRCMLHYYLGGERGFDKLNFVSEDFFVSDKRVTVLAGKRVTAVNAAAKTLTLCDGSSVNYDKLLIATGAKPFIPPIEGLKGAKNVFGFRDIDDTDGILAFAKAKSRAVIVGAGVAALDAAYGLLEKGVAVTLVEMFPRVSPLQLDEKAASAYQKLFEEHGARFRLGYKVMSADVDATSGMVKAVNIASASDPLKTEKLPCDFAVVIAGVRPNFSLLEGSGIVTDKAVTVDAHMRTSDANVYAAGDCAGLSGIWPNARAQGIVAAKNMLGSNETYTDTYAMKNTMNFYGLTTLTIGNVNIEDSGLDSFEFEDRRNYFRYVLKAGVPVAVLLQGDISRSGIWLHIIKNRINISKLDKPLHKIRYSDFYSITDKGKFEYAV